MTQGEGAKQNGLGAAAYLGRLLTRRAEEIAHKHERKMPNYAEEPTADETAMIGNFLTRTGAKGSFVKSILPSADTSVRDISWVYRAPPDLCDQRVCGHGTLGTQCSAKGTDLQTFLVALIGRIKQTRLLAEQIKADLAAA